LYTIIIFTLNTTNNALIKNKIYRYGYFSNRNESRVFLPKTHSCYDLEGGQSNFMMIRFKAISLGKSSTLTVLATITILANSNGQKSELFPDQVVVPAQGTHQLKQLTKKTPPDV
jgi:hypothetical protein